jgi:hypothetical protein
MTPSTVVHAAIFGVGAAVGAGAAALLSFSRDNNKSQKQGATKPAEPQPASAATRGDLQPQVPKSALEAAASRAVYRFEDPGKDPFFALLLIAETN